MGWGGPVVFLNSKEKGKNAPRALARAGSNFMLLSLIMNTETCLKTFKGTKRVLVPEAKQASWGCDGGGSQ